MCADGSAPATGFFQRFPALRDVTRARAEERKAPSQRRGEKAVACRAVRDGVIASRPPTSRPVFFLRSNRVERGGRQARRRGRRGRKPREGLTRRRATCPPVSSHTRRPLPRI
ncbi:Hypothetical predicted protein [Podarcis lilfordi]|uniref:Uncharacterized protein n=1 Tax=Podarcis lilfordi TaxID=74358 RepID=A0AA35L6C2_9SAUR|nr:Hypothetical predicted protein [Podarcis lilfordi]